MTMYRAEVVRTWPEGPRMQTLEVRVDDGFDSVGVGDEFVRLHLPDLSEGPAVEIPSEDDPVGYYTIRAWDSASSTARICFVLHGHGPAAAWAAAARPGARLFLSGQRGKYHPPEDTRRILLYGDATALPAIARILEDDARPEVTATVQVEHEEDRGMLTGDQRVRWIIAPTRRRALLREVASVSPGAETYVWFAGEASQMRTVRHRLRHELHLPSHRYLTMAYWRADSERYLAKLRALPDKARAELDKIWESGLPGEQQRDLAEELMVRWGVVE